MYIRGILTKIFQRKLKNENLNIFMRKRIIYMQYSGMLIKVFNIYQGFNILSLKQYGIANMETSVDKFSIINEVKYLREIYDF